MTTRRTSHHRIVSGFVLILSFLTVAFAVHAQSPVETMRQDVKYLASDSLAGRRTATPGNLLAAEYIAKRFQSIGLTPVPGGDGFFHRFAYLAGAEPGPGNSLTITTAKGSRTLTMEKQFRPMSFSESGKAEGALAFVGYGITAPDLNYDDYASIDAKGKIVVIMRYSPDGASPHGDFAHHAAWPRKVANAREHGAIGIIFINQPRDSAELVRMQLDRNFVNSGLPSVFALSTVFNDIRDSKRRTLADIQQIIDSSRHPASFQVKKLSARLVTDVVLTREQVPNVVGMIEGTDPVLKDQIIVIGGHFDHLGNGGEGSLHAGSEAAIHHGADDNASGTAGMMALAAKFAGGGNRRTLVFMAFNGEEEGLLGSDAFVKNPPFPLERIVTMVNMDMIGRLDSNNLIVQGTGTSPGWEKLLNDVNDNRFSLKLMKDGFGPSDYSSFYGKDLPVLAFFTGLHSDYHRPSDTWDKINYEGMVDVVEYMGKVITEIDHNDERPAFSKVATTASARTSGGFKVYVGSIPDYAYDGKGLRLSGVADGGPAQKAGLQGGDIIVRMNTRLIDNIYDYTDALGSFKPKDNVETEYIRDGTTMITTVTMGSR